MHVALIGSSVKLLADAQGISDAALRHLVPLAAPLRKLNLVEYVYVLWAVDPHDGWMHAQCGAEGLPSRLNRVIERQVAGVPGYI